MAATPLRAGPFWVTQTGPGSTGFAELKSLGGRAHCTVYSLRCLREAGGQMGEELVAVSRIWHPGALRGGGCV